MSKIILENQKQYIEGFRKKDDELLNEMEKFAEENRVPILSWDAAALIEQLIRISAPKRVLELGTAIGYTTIRIARNLRKKAEIHTIEKSTDNIELAKGFIERSGESGKIKVLEGNAFDILPALKKKYDFIFLDTDKEDYTKLFQYALILLKKGGILFVDNLLWHGYAASQKVPSGYRTSTKYIREFNSIFMNHPSLDSVILPVGDGIGLGVKRKL